MLTVGAVDSRVCGERGTMRRRQREKIACYLKSGRTITQDEAIKYFGCYRLSARIFELREMGMNIKTIMKERSYVDADGFPVTSSYAEYKYEQ